MFKLSEWVWQTESGMAPGMFSWFHILWLVICICSCYFAIKFAKKGRDAAKDDKFIRICISIITLSEIVKQYMFHVEYYGYLRIDILPFAFCSVPLYFAWIGSLTKNEKVKDACYKFISFYGIVGGLGVMLYPVTVLETYFIYMAIHSMLWHTMLIVMAVYLIAARGYGKNFIKEIIPPFKAFLVCCVIAIILNESLYAAVIAPSQIPSFSADKCPGSYTYYRMGVCGKPSEAKDIEGRSDLAYMLFKGGDYLYTTLDYLEANQMYLECKSEEESDVFALTCLDSDGNTSYVGERDGILVATDTPNTYWTLQWFGNDAVLTTKVDGTDCFLRVDKDFCIVFEPYSNYEKYQDEYIGFVNVYLPREGDSTNFFFISRHYETFIPGLSLVQKLVPYPVFVLCYIAGFFGVSSLVWLCAYWFRKREEMKQDKA